MTFSMTSFCLKKGWYFDIMLDMWAAHLRGRAKRPVVWSKTRDAEYPLAAVVNGETWQIRVNDFPEEELYTLLVDGRDVGSFDDWPTAWERPVPANESGGATTQPQQRSGVR